jgi:hypothetical protein
VTIYQQLEAVAAAPGELKLQTYWMIHSASFTAMFGEAM